MYCAKSVLIDMVYYWICENEILYLLILSRTETRGPYQSVIMSHEIGTHMMHVNVLLIPSKFILLIIFALKFVLCYCFILMSMV